MIYRQSHVLPSPGDPRGGSVELASIPSFITRDGHDDHADEDRHWPYLRVTVHPSEPGEDTVVLDRTQVESLRDELTGWLDLIDDGLDG